MVGRRHRSPGKGRCRLVCNGTTPWSRCAIGARSHRLAGEREDAILGAALAVKAAEAAAAEETDFDEEALGSAYSDLAAYVAAVQHPLLAIDGGRFDIEPHPRGVILRAQMIDEIGGSLSGGVAVALDAHLQDVARYAARLSQQCPYQDKIVNAARLHDAGKQEHRFQVMLHGDPLAAAAGPVLAKSGLRTLAQKRGDTSSQGYPRVFGMNWQRWHSMKSWIPSFATWWRPTMATAVPGSPFAEIKTHWAHFLVCLKKAVCAGLPDSLWN